MKIKSCVYSVTALSVLVMCVMLSPVVSYGQVSGALVWSDSDGAHEQVFFSSYDENGWQAPSQITRSENMDYLPSVGTGTDGSTWLAWSSVQQDTIALMYSVSSEGAWSEPRVFETGMKSNTAVSLVVDLNNIPWLVWAGFDGNDDEIFWSTWQDGGWSKPERVASDNNTPDLLPVLSVDANGVVTVQWQSFNGNEYIQKSRSRIGNNWQDSGNSLQNGAVSGMSMDKKMNEQVAPIPFPPIPDFVNDQDKASISLRRAGRQYSKPLRFIKK